MLLKVFPMRIKTLQIQCFYVISAVLLDSKIFEKKLKKCQKIFKEIPSLVVVIPEATLMLIFKWFTPAFSCKLAPVNN